MLADGGCYNSIGGDTLAITVITVVGVDVGISTARAWRVDESKLIHFINKDHVVGLLVSRTHFAVGVVVTCSKKKLEMSACMLLSIK